MNFSFGSHAAPCFAFQPTSNVTLRPPFLTSNSREESAMHISWIVSHRSGEGGRGFGGVAAGEGGCGLGGAAPGADVGVGADGQLGGASALGKILSPSGGPSTPVFGFLKPYRTWIDWAKESSPGYGCAVTSYHRVQLRSYTRRRASHSA